MGDARIRRHTYWRLTQACFEIYLTLKDRVNKDVKSSVLFQIIIND